MNETENITMIEIVQDLYFMQKDEDRICDQAGYTGVREPLDITDWLIDSMTGDLACGGSYSGVLNNVEIEGVPFFEFVRKIEEATDRDLESEALKSLY